MKGQAFFSTLTLAVLCVVRATTGHSTSSSSYVESTTINSSNSSSSQVIVPDDNKRDSKPEQDGDLTGSGDPLYYSQESGSWTDIPADDSSRTYRSNYYDEPSESPTRVQSNSTYSQDQPSYENSASPINCPGPIDPATGEAVLDSNGNCAIVCYNNLVPNESGDACICPPTFQYDSDLVQCVCRSPFVLRGSKCVLLPSQAAGARHGTHKKRSLNEQIPMNFEMLHGKYLRTEIDRINCPANEIACQMPTGGFECLDPEGTLESCGGCAYGGAGVDCSKNVTMGAGEVGCSAGACVVLSCQKGYALVEGTCVLKHPRKP